MQYMSFGYLEVRRLGRWLAIASAIALTMLAFGTVKASAAGVYTYCGQCTITSGSTKHSATGLANAYLAYAHRLSGPTYALTIGTALENSGGGQYCYATSTGTEVSCSHARGYMFGGTTNRGAGNYTFNAHLTS